MCVNILRNIEKTANIEMNKLPWFVPELTTDLKIDWIMASTNKCTTDFEAGN